MRAVNDGYILSTGKALYANNGIIGLSSKGTIHEGYDGDIEMDELTDLEKKEIAIFMIEAWAKVAKNETKPPQIL